MKAYIPALSATLVVGTILIGLAVWVPRLAFLLMIPFAVIGVGAAFFAKKKRELVLVLVFLSFAGVGVGRVDIVLQRGSESRGVAFQKVIWGRTAAPTEGMYLAGCEPPRYEPTHVLVVRF